MPANKNNIFSSTNSLKILSFLSENPGREFLGSEIQKGTALSRAGVYIGLRELLKHRLVSKIHRGKFFMYQAVYDNPVIRQFKVLRNILLLEKIVARLKGLSKKIILFGNAGRGEDDVKSDIDLFVLAKDPSGVRSSLDGIKLKRKIQAVINSPSEFSDLQRKDAVFLAEVNRGIALWEEKE